MMCPLAWLLFFPGQGMCTIMLGSLATVFVSICAFLRCRKCWCRDLPCMKRMFRWCGCDTFEDFTAIFVVHEVEAAFSGSKPLMAIRLHAGRHQVTSDESKDGRFHQPLELFVEQGSSSIEADLMDSRKKKVLATLKFDPDRDVIQPTEGGKVVRERQFSMKQKGKGIVNPRLKLTIRRDIFGAEEEGLLKNISPQGIESTLMLREQLHKVSAANDASGGGSSSRPDAPQLTELELLLRACAGPLDMFGGFGGRQRVHVAVRGPPLLKRHMLGIWADEQAFDNAKAVIDEIDLLKIASVQPDPARSDVFVMNFVQGNLKISKRQNFARVDRARDVWVEMICLLIKKVREMREARKMNG